MGDQVEQFPFPPLTEAVIEFRFENSLDDKQLNRALESYMNIYESKEDQHHYNINVKNNAGTATIDKQLTGHRLASKDGIDILLCRRNALACSRLAPYDGWNRLKARSMEALVSWRENVGVNPIHRIGVRYINRIDLPLTGEIDVAKFLRFYPQFPAMMSKAITRGYTMQISQILQEKFELNLTTATIEPPSFKYTSILLDIDLGSIDQLPMRLDEISDYLEIIRALKNDIFYELLTDDTRVLFREKEAST